VVSGESAVRAAGVFELHGPQICRLKLLLQVSHRNLSCPLLHRSFSVVAFGFTSWLSDFADSIAEADSTLIRGWGEQDGRTSDDEGDDVDSPLEILAA
jgi:hypothetical protein